MVKLRSTKWDTSTKASPSHDIDIGAYDVLVGKSKKLGRTATQAFFEVKQFLRKDIAIPSISLNPLKRSHDTRTPNEARHTIERPELSEAEKSELEKEREAIEKLKKTVERSHEVLAYAKSTFPFSLFPDTVFVDRTKITIVKNDFFFSSTTISIRVEDVLNVTVGVGPFFGTLSIASRVMNSTDHFIIEHLKRNDATHLKHLIQGYMIAQHNNIQTSHLSKQELIDTLCELGADTARQNGNYKQ